MPAGGPSWDIPHWSSIPTALPWPVDVFESVDLPAHWERLDMFEGVGYERVVTTVRTPTGSVEASIYVLAGAGRQPGLSDR